MKFLITLILIITFSACSHKNAFSEFNMNSYQELAIASLKRVKIINNNHTIGAFNAIYLNEVYPDEYYEAEYFFVYIYLNDNQEIKLSLNAASPIALKTLKAKNKFSDLSASSNNWNRYYLVSFDKQGEKLTLKLQSNQSFSAVLKYHKDKQ